MLGGPFSDLVVTEIKEGKVFRGIGDNWDLKTLKGSMWKDIINEDLHLFASNLIENRLNLPSHWPNKNSKGNMKDLQQTTFSLSVNEWMQYAENAKVIVQFLPYFKFFKSVIPEHILPLYSKQMAEWSTIISANCQC